MARKAALIQAGLEGEAIDTALEKFAEASDEMFTEIVQLIASKGIEVETETQVDETEALDSEEDAEAEDTEDTDEAEAEADAEVLEDVEEAVEAALTDDTDADSVQDARMAASAWLRNSVLRTTASLVDDEN